MAARKHTFILCFDFDGTLVHPESDPAFHPALGDMIRQLRHLGAAWVINTGRSLEQTLQGLGSHGIFMEPDFIIAQECEIFKPGIISKWTDFGAWNRTARKAHDRFMRDHKRSLDAIRHMVETQTKAEFMHGDFGQVGVVATTDEEMDRICEYIDTHSREFPDIGYHRNSIYLRFSHSAYGKGTALGELTRLLELNATQVFAAGDNHNDVTMLDRRFAAQIACPGNALPPIKEIVKSRGGFVASGVASVGMIEALNHFFATKPA
ncbi:MAG: HAD hydrolase family protein [Verrucomicrobiaceae bacterium]|nr:HAD hydrolase family protein [Verrucomicrobiaceae bacterium]